MLLFKKGKILNTLTINNFNNIINLYSPIILCYNNIINYTFYTLFLIIILLSDLFFFVAKFLLTVDNNNYIATITIFFYFDNAPSLVPSPFNISKHDSDERRNTNI